MKASKYQMSIFCLTVKTMCFKELIRTDAIMYMKCEYSYCEYLSNCEVSDIHKVDLFSTYALHLIKNIVLNVFIISYHIINTSFFVIHIYLHNHVTSTIINFVSSLHNDPTLHHITLKIM